MQIKPKKSLGQNFLVDNNVLEKIVDCAKIENNTAILEIGPGTGNLTEYLVKKNPKKIFVIEKDKYLVELLKKKIGNKINIFGEDFLSFSNSDLINENLTIFGNLPYNISSQILVKLIINKENLKYQQIVFMFQKELADRILCKQNSKNYGRLSILANWKFNIHKVLDIKPTSFRPIPKVKSSLLLFTPKKKIFKINNPENLEYITRVFFNQRRKKIKKPINILFQNKINLQNTLNLDLNLRPQNLSIETFLKIVNEYEKLI